MTDDKVKETNSAQKHDLHSHFQVGFPNPKDDDDNQGYCGGFGVQFNRNGGRCGICGDPWHVIPREHEAPGGIFANGIIGRTYQQVRG